MGLAVWMVDVSPACLALAAVCWAGCPASGPGDRPHAEAANLKLADVFILLALHANRIVRYGQFLSGEKCNQHLCELVGVYGAARYDSIDLDYLVNGPVPRLLEERVIVALGRFRARMPGIHLFLVLLGSPFVSHPLDSAEIGACSHCNKDTGPLPYLLDPLDIHGPGYGALDYGNVIFFR